MRPLISLITNWQIPLAKLKKYAAESGVPINQLMIQRRATVEHFNLLRIYRHSIRALRRLDLSPSPTGNFLNPVDGLIYQMPRQIEPDRWTPPLGLRSMNARYRLHKRHMDIVRINSSTIPKHIGTTMCGDLPTEQSLAAETLINRTILRMTPIEPYIFEVWTAPGAKRQYLALDGELFSLGKTLKGVKAGLITKKKHQIIKRIS